MEQFQMNPFDLSAIVEAQKKNIEAFSQARTMALEGLQSLLQRQTDTLLQIVDSASSLMQTGNLQNNFAWHTDMIKNTCTDSAARWHEMAGIIGKTGKETSDVIRNHDVPKVTALKPAPRKYKIKGKHVRQKKAA